MVRLDTQRGSDWIFVHRPYSDVSDDDGCFRRAGRGHVDRVYASAFPYEEVLVVVSPVDRLERGGGGGVRGFHVRHKG